MGPNDVAVGFPSRLVVIAALAVTMLYLLPGCEKPGDTGLTTIPKPRVMSPTTAPASTTPAAEPEPARKPPTDADLKLQQGNAYLQRGQLDAAEQQFRAAIHDQPSALAYERLGLTLLRRDDFSQADQQYRRALAMDPKCINALNGRGICLAHQYTLSDLPDFRVKAEAVELLQQSLRLNPNQPSVIELLAHLSKH